MRTSVFLSIVLAILCVVQVNAKEFDIKNLRSVFVPAKKKSGTIELIRLFRDQTFEHLVYSIDDDFMLEDGTRVRDARYYSLKRNTGSFKLVDGELTLKAKSTSFESSLYDKKLLIENSKIYDSKLNAIFKKDEFILRAAVKKTGDQPYYLDPEEGRFVTNEEAVNWFDLDELNEYVCKDIYGSKEKINAVWEYIRKSIVYDQKGYETGDYANNQGDFASILAGQKRVAVCAGYSMLFKAFLDKCNVRAEYLTGLAKTSSGRIEPHAWNAVFGGKDLEMYDITWGWKEVDPSLMIYTHLPKEPKDQLIDKPITEREFRQLAYTAPTAGGAYYVPFLPSNFEIDVNNKLLVRFKGSTGTLSINSYDIQTRNNKTLSYRSQLAVQGWTVLEIPVESKEAIIELKTSNGYSIQYYVTNTGIDQKKESDDKVWTTSDGEIIKRFQEETTKKTSIIQMPQSASLPQNKTLSERVQGTFISDLFQYTQLTTNQMDHPLIKEALKYYGLTEQPGKKNNKTIVGFFKTTGNKRLTKDEDAWCSVFLAVCAKNAGMKYTNNALARSWLNVGQAVDEPQPGDIVIFWRDTKDSYKGHVAIWLGETSDGVICLGGNQGDSVCIGVSEKNTVLGYRRLTKN